MINFFIEEKAEKLISEAGLLMAPTDVIKCAEHLSINIDYLNLDAGISGFLVQKDGKTSIVVNSAEKPFSLSIKSKIKHRPSRRQRFTIAHEIGHYILHKNEGPLFVDKGETVMYRDTNSTSGEYRREREANAFAAALLMPKISVEKKIEEKLTSMGEGYIGSLIEELSNHFEVSEQAMSFRLGNLGYEFGMF